MAVTLILLAAPACIHLTRANAFQKATNLGEYEQQMWESVKAAKWNDVRAHMAESYRCSMPNGDDMVVTYDLELRGTAGGQPLFSGPVHVLTVWQSVKRGWIEVAQSITTAGQWPAGPAMFKPQ